MLYLESGKNSDIKHFLITSIYTESKKETGWIYIFNVYNDFCLCFETPQLTGSLCSWHCRRLGAGSILFLLIWDDGHKGKISIQSNQICFPGKLILKLIDTKKVFSTDLLSEKPAENLQELLRLRSRGSI